MPDQVPNIEQLLARLYSAHEAAQAEYLQLLSIEMYDAALQKLNKMDLIEAHINRMEEL